MCVCVHMCVNTPAAVDRHTQQNGQMEARRDGWWMDGLCGEGGTPFEIQPCRPIEEDEGGGAALKPNAALSSKFCRRFLVASKSW